MNKLYENRNGEFFVLFNKEQLVYLKEKFRRKTLKERFKKFLFNFWRGFFGI